MRTVCIQIGNTDNRLKQGDWAHFVEHMKQALEQIVSRVHFFGGSATYDPWQNVCWVCEIDDESMHELKSRVRFVRRQFHQESAALLIGSTELI